MIKTLSLLVIAFALSACGATAISQCEEAQARNCTTIKGSCSKLYDAIDSISRSKASCASEADAYESCAGSHDACTISASCSSEENALTRCLGVFCLANSSDPDCVYIADNG